MAYAVGWLLLPETNGAIHLEEILAGRFSPGGVGALVVLIISIFSIGPVAAFGDGPSFGGLIALAALVLVIIVMLHAFGVIGRPNPGAAPVGGPVDLDKHHGGEGTAMQHTGYGPSVAPHTGYGPSVAPHTGYGPPAAPPGTPFQGSAPWQPPAPPKPRKQRPPRRGYPGGAATTLAAGLALLVAGAIVVMRDELPAGADVSAVAWAGVLGLLALATVVAGLSGRRSGWIGALAAAACVFAISQSVSGAADDTFFADDVTWAPTSLDSDVTEYQLDAGSALLDLTDLDLTEDSGSGGTDSRDGLVPEVSADVSVGELRVLIPEDLSVQLDTGVGLGDLSGGSEGTSRVGAAGSPDLRLNLNVGIGSMTIEEVSR